MIYNMEMVKANSWRTHQIYIQQMKQSITGNTGNVLQNSTNNMTC